MKKRILNALRHCLEDAGLYHKNASLLAAVSGGADSMALLLSLAMLRQEMPFRLTVCHVQHALRGESSLRDEALVQETCRKLDLPCVVDHAGLTGDMLTPGMETMARDKRRQIFIRRMETLPADALLTAHHRDDQAETLLMHLLRGAGLKGLCGMRVSSPLGKGLLLRPLLDFSKKDLILWLKQEGFSFCHDESNDHTITLRNALRLDVLPRLEALCPGAGKRIASSALGLQQDEDCLASLAEDLYRRSLWQGGGMLCLKTAPLRQAHPTLALRAIRQLYREGLILAGCHPEENELSREDSQKALALLCAHAGETMNLPENLMFLRGSSRLWLLRQGELPLAPAAVVQPLELKNLEGSFRYGMMEFRISPAPDRWQPSPMGALLTDEEKSCALLRFASPGDTIHPMGASGSKPLRRFMTDRHIDRPLRPILPLLSMGSEVIWLPGLCCAERLRRESPKGLWLMEVTNAAESCIHIDKE